MKQQNDTNFFASESDQDRVSVNMSGDILVRRAFNANPNQLKDEDWQNKKLDVFYQFIFEVIRDFKRDGYLNIDEEYYPIMIIYQLKLIHKWNPLMIKENDYLNPI